MSSTVAYDINNAPLCVAAQLWLVEYLLSRESLLAGANRVPVIGRRETNIADDIDAAIKSLGACIYVMPMLTIKLYANVPGPAFDCEVRFRCIENDTLNENLPSVYELVEAVVRDVHGLRIPPLAALGCLSLAPSQPVQRVADDERVIFDVLFNTKGAYAARLEQR